MQALLAVNDMFYLSSPHTASIFYDDAVEWLDQEGVRYTPRIKFAGKSGYDHMFDFVIPKSSQAPERLVQIANVPTKSKVKDLMFKWSDVKQIRENNSKSYILLNDEESIQQAAIEAFVNYDSIPVIWSEREQYAPELAA